jgi:hypothetical protein
MSITDDSRDGENDEKQSSDGAFERLPALQESDHDPDERPGRDGGPRYAYGSIEAWLLRGARLAHAHVAVGMHDFTGAKASAPCLKSV